MNRRLFPNDPPWIAFKKNFQQLVHGDLVPGTKVKILYDSDRVPAERSMEDGHKAWTIRAFYKFVEAGPVHQVDLWTESGAMQSKMSNDTAEGTIMVCSIYIPEGADHMSIWFLNTGKSGAEFWDSNFGRNYIFRFVVEDFQVESVKVVPVPEKSLAQFEVELKVASDVSSIGVSYWIANASVPAAAPSYLALRQMGPPDESGRQKWSGSVPVPQKAVVRFTFQYSAWGNEHVDNNSDHGYLTWPGAVRDLQAGVL
jgi:hypothetical protein